jgi:hypothetical protein
MANTLLPVHAQDITDSAVISFKNHCVLARYVDRQYDKLWGQAGAKRGTTINLRYPPQYELRRGNRASPQASTETYFPVTLGEPIGVDMDFTSQELLLTVDDFMNRFVKKGTLPVANGVDSDIAALYKKVPNFSGVPGTVPTSIETYLEATTILARNGAPVEGDEWAMVIDYKSNQKIINALIAQQNPQGAISRQWESARMVSAMGYKWSQDQNIKIHTVGDWTGLTVLANSATAQTGASIVCDGATAATCKEGDIVTFAATRSIKPNSVPLNGAGESTGELKQFVVTADTDAVGAAITIPISPSIVTTGAYQNVTQGVADNSAVLLFGHANSYSALTSRQNLAFNKGAFVLGMVDLPLPGGMDMSARTTDEDAKVSMRFLRGFDITENTFISRLDLLHVAACPRPEFCVRVVG